MSKTISQAIGWDASGKRHEYDLVVDSAKFLGANNVPGYRLNQNKVLHLCFYKTPTNILQASLREMIDGIAVGPGTDEKPNKNYWDNWRDGSSLISGASDIALRVPPNVYPVLSNFNIEGGFEIGSISVQDTLKEGSNAVLEGIYTAAGVAAKAGEAINAASKGVAALGGAAKSAYNAAKDHSNGKWQDRAAASINAASSNFNTSSLAQGMADKAIMKNGALTSRFDNFPIFDAEKTKAIAPKSIELQFNIGCGNYFDGEIEVVRPIAAIENKIIPVLAEESKNKLLAPMGSPAQFSAAVWGASAGAIGDTLTSIGADLVDNTREIAAGGVSIKEVAGRLGEDLATIGYHVQANIIAAKDAAVAALGPYTVLLFMRLGNATLGPFAINSCSHSFDYSQVDEKGYPSKGTLSLGVEYIFKPNMADNLSQLGYKVEDVPLPNA